MGGSRWRAALHHATAMQTLFEGDERTRPGHFDPAMLELFRQFEAEFVALYHV